MYTALQLVLQVASAATVLYPAEEKEGRGFADRRVYNSVVSCCHIRSVLGFPRESVAPRAHVMRYSQCVSSGQLGKAVPNPGAVWFREALG